MSHDPPVLIIICWFGAPETFVTIISSSSICVETINFFDEWKMLTFLKRTSKPATSVKKAFNWCAISLLDNIWMRCNYLNIWNLRVIKQIIYKYWENCLKICPSEFKKFILLIKTCFEISTEEHLHNFFLKHDLYLIFWWF